MNMRYHLKNEKNSLWIAYDGDCPFCSAYVRIISLRKSVQSVFLVNARDKHPFLDEIKTHGLDLNSGMVAKYGGRIYYAHEVINLISLLSSKSGTANQIMAILFRNKEIARLLYPSMVMCRNLTLRMLGKSLIDRNRPSED